MILEEQAARSGMNTNSCPRNDRYVAERRRTNARFFLKFYHFLCPILLHQTIFWAPVYLVVGCWRGCLSGARCRLAYGPADATATHCLLLQ